MTIKHNNYASIVFFVFISITFSSYAETERHGSEDTKLAEFFETLKVNTAIGAGVGFLYSLSPASKLATHYSAIALATTLEEWPNIPEGQKIIKIVGVVIITSAFILIQSVPYFLKYIFTGALGVLMLTVIFEGSRLTVITLLYREYGEA